MGGDARSIGRATIMVLALVMLTGSGCAQLKALRKENAKLQTENATLSSELACCGTEKDRLTKDRDRERERADQAVDQLVAARTDLAKAQGEAAAERARAEGLEQQLAYMKELVTQLQQQNERMLVALQKAWARKGRGFIDALVKLKREGFELKLDACNACPGGSGCCTASPAK